MNMENKLEQAALVLLAKHNNCQSVKNNRIEKSKMKHVFNTTGDFYSSTERREKIQSAFNNNIHTLN